MMLIVTHLASGRLHINLVNETAAKEIENLNMTGNDLVQAVCYYLYDPNEEIPNLPPPKGVPFKCGDGFKHIISETYASPGTIQDMPKADKMLFLARCNSPTAELINRFLSDPMRQGCVTQ